MSDPTETCQVRNCGKAYAFRQGDRNAPGGWLALCDEHVHLLESMRAAGEARAEADRLRGLVPVMRALGVAQAFGIVLGPEPTKVETLARAVDEKPTPELEAELRKAKRQAEIEELRDLLSANGHEYTDEQLERLLPPEGT